jgi:hypothetical protein
LQKFKFEAINTARYIPYSDTAIIIPDKKMGKQHSLYVGNTEFFGYWFQVNLRVFKCILVNSVFAGLNSKAGNMADQIGVPLIAAGYTFVFE